MVACIFGLALGTGLLTGWIHEAVFGPNPREEFAEVQGKFDPLIRRIEASFERTGKYPEHLEPSMMPNGVEEERDFVYVPDETLASYVLRVRSRCGILRIAHWRYDGVSRTWKFVS